MTPIGYTRAYKTVVTQISRLGICTLPLQACMGHVAAQKITALVGAPSADASLMDGYALNSSDIKTCGSDGPARLAILGSSAAGQQNLHPLKQGTCKGI